MEDISRDISRTREDQYFLKLEQRRLEEMRRNSAREAETSRLMAAFGIREPELVRELADAGFDIETFRLLYLVPPCTAAMAWWLFGEAFTPLMILGMLLTVCGVAMVVRDRG